MAERYGAASSGWLGRKLRVTVGAVAHGGHCVARYEGRVIFVRHALPDEDVLVEITEDKGGAFCRGDAVEILRAAPQRVEPPCPYAHPGGCGGCDFQHASLSAQRTLKASVVAEQLKRLAGIDLPVTVQPVGDAPESGLGWRRRIRYAVAPDGQLGLRAHRSHEVIGIAKCLIGAPGVGDTPLLGRRLPGLSEVEVAIDVEGAVAAIGRRQRPKPTGRSRARGRAAGRARQGLTEEQLSGSDRLIYHAAARTFTVRAAGFWQTHPAAADTFAAAILDVAGLVPGARALDLYAGAGLFSAVLAEQVGEHGIVLALEGDARAAEDAVQNLADLPWAQVRAMPVTEATVLDAVREVGGFDVVVLDPPRSGAGADVLEAILDSRPATVIYVACDPAALARDVRTALDHGWRLADLKAFDAFPMTHHVECIATLSAGRVSAG